MLFNSIDFAIFLPIVFTCYWLINSFDLRWQNALILVASYIFYGWWDPRFLLLIILSTLVDYSVGLALKRTENPFRRRSLLWISIIVNIGALGFFKYSNFFIENFTDAFSILGTNISSGTLDIILPVGISFYTFQTLSYTIDVYRKRLEPTKDPIAFAAFVGFFPQLVAGPIERATNLLPQFKKRRTFDYAKSVDGLRQILWGLFKKIVIADGCATYVNTTFNDFADQPGSALAVSAIFFAFQIYADFSGYSDIAIGTSRLFGFNLMRNFAFPYFSRDIAEFWRRWHISLSTWFRDYLYIPLGGSHGNVKTQIRNIFIIFIVSGFWHGANWTFIVWGALNAIYFLPLLLLKRNRKNIEIVAENNLLPTVRDVFGIMLTFSLTVFAWIFFRAESIQQAIAIITKIASESLLVYPPLLENEEVINVIILLIGFIMVEWIGRKQQFAIASFGLSWFRPVRWGFYILLAVLIAINSSGSEDFIYFQF